MDRDELEFLISQHFDGTLDEAEAARLRTLVSADGEAQSLFDEHARLDAVLRSSASALTIDEDWLGGQISDAIDEANSKPMRISRFAWAPLAMAACLLFGLTLGIVFLRDEDEKIASNVPPSPAVPEIVFLGNPTPAPRPTEGYASVSVGVPANMTPQIVSALYLSRDLSENRVSIRAAGRRSADAFD